MAPGLRELFLEHAGAHAEGLRKLPRLEEELAQLVADAKSAWLGVELPAIVFLAYLAERLPEDDASSRNALARVRTTDLYLACACARGDPTAIAWFEERFLPDVASYIGRRNAALADEAGQLLRVRLLVPREGALPGIVKYRGSGALGGWVRTVCVRLARELGDAQRWHLPLDDQRDADLKTSDPELRYLKRRYGRELSSALSQVLAGLGEDNRKMLALHFLDGLSSDVVARLLRVDGSTVRRRIARVREAILDETRRRLVERLRIGDSECDSLIGLVRSQLAVSIVRHLKQ